MSGIKPFFVTGANVKILVNGKTMAFCTDFSCTVDVITQTPKVLGKYEGSSVEPLGYTVAGSFTLVRYAKNAVNDIGGKNPSGTINEANGIANWRGSLYPGSNSDIQLNPADLENASAFDIEIYQKLSNNDEGLGVIKIRNARITRAEFAVSKRSVATQRFSFMAQYADEDSFKADFSGQASLI
jgi:hypothetical protein